MTKKEKLLRRDLIECKILNCVDNAKACYCSQAGSWRVQAVQSEWAQLSLSFRAYSHKISGAWDRDKQEEVASVHQG